MTALKSGDLVVLKSGGPVMTVDTVNTDIFDDNKVTGILCAWFVGDKLVRARFDQAALAPASSRGAGFEKSDTGTQEAAGEYKAVLDEMVAAMNAADDPSEEAPGVANGKTIIEKRPKRASFRKAGGASVEPPAGGAS